MLLKKRATVKELSVVDFFFTHKIIVLRLEKRKCVKNITSGWKKGRGREREIYTRKKRQYDDVSSQSSC